MELQKFIDSLEFDKTIVYANNKYGIPTAYRFKSISIGSNNYVSSFDFVSAEDKQLHNLLELFMNNKLYATLTNKLQLSDCIVTPSSRWDTCQVIKQWFVRYYNSKTDKKYGTATLRLRSDNLYTDFLFERWQWINNAPVRRLMFYDWASEGCPIILDKEGFHPTYSSNSYYPHEVNVNIPSYKTREACQAANKAIAFTFDDEQDEWDVEHRERVAELKKEIKTLQDEISEKEKEIDIIEILYK